MSQVPTDVLRESDRAFNLQQQEVGESISKTAKTLITTAPKSAPDFEVTPAATMTDATMEHAARQWEEAQMRGGRYKRSGEAYTAKDCKNKYKRTWTESLNYSLNIEE